MSTKRFRIAFSFAGEKRDFVAKVAAPLAARFGSDKILYDKYHEAEFARRDLGIYLPELYHKNSDLVVVVVCPAYDEKEWTGLEWTAIHDLLKHREDNEVMLCRFEHAEVAGLYSTAGFIELDEKTPEEAAALILERLALNEGKPKNHYGTDSTTSARPARTTIPNNLPRLQSFFGRAEELKQITDALDPESRTWGALIDGPGGMGKTSLAVRAAYDCEPDQFQRIIFVSVKDREMDEDGERTLGNLLVPGFLEMLNEIARELGLNQANIRRHLVVFFAYFRASGRPFEFGGCALGNLIFSGAYLGNQRNFNAAIGDIVALMKSQARLVNVSDLAGVRAFGENSGGRG